MRKLFGLNFHTGLLIGCAIAATIATVAVAYERYDTKTLKRTIRRDAVLCGVNTGLPGFSSVDDKGNWSGFDVDFAARLRRPSSTIRTRSSSCRSTPRNALSN